MVKKQLRPRRTQNPEASGTAGTRRTKLRWLAAGVATLAAGGGAFALSAVRSPAIAVANLDLETVTVDPLVVDLGRVRLDLAVPVTVHLLNQSRKAVILGQATAETLEGC